MKVFVELLLLCGLIALASLAVVLLKAEKRKQYISSGKFHFHEFWMTLITTVGAGLRWLLIIFVCIRGSALVLKIRL
ncbi:MAG: hypothetical protein LH491_01030 [Pseudoxanthomonas sp.]|nr:hypothetical protein [Pseudoxanthomonas sp.]